MRPLVRSCFTALLIAALPASALAEDADRDGVVDEADLCPHTLPGVPQLVPGCGALDLMGRPEAVLAPVRRLAEQVDELARMPRFAGKPELTAALTSMSMMRLGLAEAAQATRLGSPCDGQALVERADADLADAGTQLDVLLRNSLADIAPLQTDDIPDFEVANAELTDRIRVVKEARAGVSVAGGALGVLCRKSFGISARGVIVGLADDDSRVTLDDGRIIGLPTPRQAREPLWLNETVQMAAMDFGDKTGFATTIASDIGWKGGINPKVTTCSRLAIVPVQQLPPENGKPVLLHNPAGYNFGGTYRFEIGMGLAAKSVCNEAPNQINTDRYTLQIDLAYTDYNGAAVKTTLASDLEPGESPVFLPSDVKPGSSATFNVTYRVQHCLPGPPGWGCDQPTVILNETYNALVTQLGGRCTAQLDAPEYDVNDQIPNHFRPAHVTGFSMVPNPPVPAPTFEAQGYSVSGNVSSFPQINTITNGQVFALHSTDFAPIYPDQGIGALGEFFATLGKHGVTHAAGLRWPHIRGKNAGWEFQFSCEMPKVVRDVVNFCANGNAYYRLPFAKGDTGWVQGQGNNSQPTHSGSKKFAYDMVTTCGSSIIAGRAGRVVSVTEGNTWQHDPGCDGNPANCCPKVAVSCGSLCCTEVWCNSNNVKLLHQDGTKGWYFHMPKDGVLPAMGDFVPRGGAIAAVGTIGNSSGPHLHFEANDTSAVRNTMLAKFEALNPADVNQKLTCYIPLNKDVLRSNNIPQ